MPRLREGEVRILNRAAGVCGTDVHIYRGEEGSAAVVPPVALGHEYSGEVCEIGTGVQTVAVGDKVTVDPNIYCGRCDACRDGMKQHCSQLVALGVNFDGGFAQSSVAPQEQCYRLSQGVTYEEGAMAEPVACCLHGIDEVRIRPGETVLVVGGGAIGQIMIQLARLSGAAQILLSEPAAARREMGLQMGADAVADPMRDSVPERVKRLTDNRGADVVVECAGNVTAVEQAIQATRPGARTLLFSVPSPGATFALPLFDVFKKELKIRGSFINPDTHRRAVQLINYGRLNLKPLITHRYPLNEVEQAILAQSGGDSVKVMVLPQEES
jgi:2-desacetyl-2-hydroxyethyl bacteriochlorophyllide A dehydrogenase